ncbi:Flavin prenyltransferase PAD1, mitochondrial [Paraburkholderia hiiakae]|uniref:Flavin prenyltransferase PAD1, mitochondrial n=1 Tax=Paraburkholderia hiiakae TaxID=1081782 RepID=A0ABM8NMJ6_9BURK|nr:Flavin prenyltransferase PAD1, mitochondrial [Paraburkholderia hiiakae]
MFHRTTDRLRPPHPRSCPAVSRSARVPADRSYARVAITTSLSPFAIASGLNTAPSRPKRASVSGTTPTPSPAAAKLITPTESVVRKTLAGSNPASRHITREYESGLSREAVHALADHVHPIADVGASIASGSFRTLGMLVVPCSMRTVGEIASGVTSTLLTRAADVVLKERLPLVLMVREAPLNLIHLRNMTTVTEAGAVVLPPVPAFYAKPASLQAMVDHSVSRALDQFGLDTERIAAWRDACSRRGHAAHN